MLFHSRLTRAVLSFCCGSSVLLTLGFYSGVIYLDCRWTELDLCSAKWMEKQNRKFRGTRRRGVIFLSVFLDVGLGLPSILVKLNLYFPAPLKVAGENVTHYGWRRYRTVWRFHTMTYQLLFLFVSGYCIVLPVIVKGKVTFLSFCFNFFFNVWFFFFSQYLLFRNTSWNSVITLNKLC